MLKKNVGFNLEMAHTSEHGCTSMKECALAFLGEGASSSRRRC